MVKYLLKFLFAIDLFIMGFIGCAAESAAPPEIELQPCEMGLPTAQCGTLTVFENRQTLSGRTIDLNIVVLPATNAVTDPTPLFYLAGGPGQSAVESYPLIAPTFERINQQHDIVLLDQRGTGGSHPLTCPVSAEEDTTFIEIDEATIRQVIGQCRDSLDADLTQYTTETAVADLDEVRQKLGYNQINLYGGSYGTRAALAYMRAYPQQVRAVILDGVVPPDFYLLRDAPQDGQRALEIMFARCEADDTCRDTFPRLQEKFEAILAQLDDAPVTVTLPHPVTAETIDIELTRFVFTQIIFNLSYSPELVALLPLLITQAHDTGDFGPLVAQMLLVSESTGLYYGMFYAVTCAEDAPFMTMSDLTAHSQDTYFGVMAEAFLIGCSEWPQGAVTADFHTPLHSDIPVLLLSGEADPITPPRHAEAAAATLSHHLHLVAPGQGHIVINRGCLPRIATNFINSGAVTELNTACVNDLAANPFFINYSGPQP